MKHPRITPEYSPTNMTPFSYIELPKQVNIPHIFQKKKKEKILKLQIII